MRLNQKSGEMKKNITITTEDSLFERVSSLIEESRKQVAKAVNTAMVYLCYSNSATLSRKSELEK